MKGASAATCTRECIKGFDYALVVGDKVHTLKGDWFSSDSGLGQGRTAIDDPSGYRHHCCGLLSLITVAASDGFIPSGDSIDELSPKLWRLIPP